MNKPVKNSCTDSNFICPSQYDLKIQIVEISTQLSNISIQLLSLEKRIVNIEKKLEDTITYKMAGIMLSIIISALTLLFFILQHKL